MKNGPIILIDDDADDLDLLTNAFAEMNIDNEIITFNASLPLLEYLSTTKEQPFLIIADINMPKINGLELRRKIENSEELRRKSIPFIFMSTASGPREVNEAYELSVQGYFIKQDTFDAIQSHLQVIYNYWQHCKHPNS